MEVQKMNITCIVARSRRHRRPKHHDSAAQHYNTCVHLRPNPYLPPFRTYISAAPLVRVHCSRPRRPRPGVSTMAGLPDLHIPIQR